ncbi:MAG: hypothetical protein ABIO48_16330 [Pedococcus sp.]
MRLKRLIVIPAAAGALVLVGMSSASAGEITGNGKPPGGEGLGSAHAHSICAFSGLEDGDGAGFPGPGGAPPQNWGHVQQAERAAGATPADLKASGFQPGDSCNGHRGFLAGGGEEP